MWVNPAHVEIWNKTQHHLAICDAIVAELERDISLDLPSLSEWGLRSDYVKALEARAEAIATVDSIQTFDDLVTASSKAFLAFLKLKPLLSTLYILNLPMDPKTGRRIGHLPLSDELLPIVPVPNIPLPAVLTVSPPRPTMSRWPQVIFVAIVCVLGLGAWKGVEWIQTFDRNPMTPAQQAADRQNDAYQYAVDGLFVNLAGPSVWNWADDNELSTADRLKELDGIDQHIASARTQFSQLTVPYQYRDVNGQLSGVLDQLAHVSALTRQTIQSSTSDKQAVNAQIAAEAAISTVTHNMYAMSPSDGDDDDDDHRTFP